MLSGCVWNIFGIYLASFWDMFGIVFGPLFYHFLNCSGIASALFLYDYWMVVDFDIQSIEQMKLFNEFSIASQLLNVDVFCVNGMEWNGRYRDSFATVFYDGQWCYDDGLQCHQIIQKNRFTQVWGIFLDYEIDYIVQRSSILNNDVIMFHIFGSLVYNQNLFMKKNGKSNHYRDEWWNDIIHMGDKKGMSAMTISDLTGIPRPTVIRKLKVLMNEKNVIKDKNNLYSFKDGPLMKKFNEIRMQNVEKLSSTIASFNNIVIDN